MNSDVKPGKLKQSANLANFDREGKRSLRKGQTQIVEHFQSHGSTNSHEWELEEEENLQKLSKAPMKD